MTMLGAAVALACNSCLQAGLVKSKPENIQPFTPFGVRGIFNGAAIVFFSYIGKLCCSRSSRCMLNITTQGSSC
jgi:hypothetical protein